MSWPTYALVALLSLPGVAAAQSLPPTSTDKGHVAETRRLTDELKGYLRDGKRAGVERTYRTLLAHEPRMDPELHVLAARAAQERGDALLTLARLQRVPPGAPAQGEVMKVMESLLTRYGYVRISAPKGTEMSGPALFNPMERAAIDYAIEIVKTEGSFWGLLPAGAYMVGDQAMTVEEAKTANAVVP